jgi:hypothetical protein
MDINTVPVQSLVTLFGSLLSIIGILLIIILTGFKDKVNDTNALVKKLEEEVNKNLDKKADKTTVSKLETDINGDLDKKANKDVIEQKFDTIIDRLDTLVELNSETNTKVDGVVSDISFMKGKEEARRERATK